MTRPVTLAPKVCYPGSAPSRRNIPGKVAAGVITALVLGILGSIAFVIVHWMGGLGRDDAKARSAYLGFTGNRPAWTQQHGAFDNGPSSDASGTTSAFAHDASDEVATLWYTYVNGVGYHITQPRQTWCRSVETAADAPATGLGQQVDIVCSATATDGSHSLDVTWRWTVTGSAASDRQPDSDDNIPLPDNGTVTVTARGRVHLVGVRCAASG